MPVHRLDSDLISFSHAEQKWQDQYASTSHQHTPAFLPNQPQHQQLASQIPNIIAKPHVF